MNFEEFNKTIEERSRARLSQFLQHKPKTEINCIGEETGVDGCRILIVEVLNPPLGYLLDKR